MTLSREAQLKIGRTGLSRRNFLRKTLGTVLFGTTAALYGDRYEPDDLVVTRTDVFLPRLGREADGLKIGLLSDFHGDYEHAILRTVRAAKLLMLELPDIVFILGDYVSSHVSGSYVVPTIAGLQLLTGAPLGAYAVMGNHDCWGNMHYFATKILREAGFIVLNNLSVPLPGVPGVFIVGLDDAGCGRMNVRKALEGVPSDAPKIVALHEPDFADMIGPGFDLQLSGHSHGGQVRIPGLPPLHTPIYGQKYPEGLQQANNHWVYTTRGVGMMGPQIRAFCPPEVTVLTIRHSDSSV